MVTVLSLAQPYAFIYSFTHSFMQGTFIESLLSINAENTKRNKIQLIISGLP